jgi:histidine ammonia-lyase
MPSTPFNLPPEPLELTALRDWLRHPGPVAYAPETLDRIAACRAYLDGKLADGKATIYGVNTGFGALCHVTISGEQTAQLQVNLLRSHAVGCGDPVPAELVRLMLLLKARSLGFGHSGVRPETALRLLELLNADCLPVVPEQGSLGASGDLAPLAHLALPLIGEGEVTLGGERMPSAEGLARLGLEPLALQAKEGLALINGTQFMLAYAVAGQLEAERLAALADLVAALALEARGGRPDAFDPAIHRIRPHAGHARCAERVRDWIAGSPTAAAPKAQVQDNYSFRCTPQVHGASLDAMAHTAGVFTRELNAVTDNPLLFPEEDRIISGGNFHGQPLALPLDYLAIAVAELASIAERRTYRLLSGEKDLPPFLTRGGGLHSGLMIPQYTAAALVSQNKQLCTPASVDSIPSSNEQEDHVSMGANGATKLWRVLRNTERVLGIAFLTAAQALDLQRPAVRTSPRLETLLARYRERVPVLEEDRWLQPDIEATVAFLREVEA